MYLCISAIPKVFSIQGKEVKLYVKAANAVEEPASARGVWTVNQAASLPGASQTHISRYSGPFLTAACVSASGPRTFLKDFLERLLNTLRLDQCLLVYWDMQIAGLIKIGSMNSDFKMFYKYSKLGKVSYVTVNVGGLSFLKNNPLIGHP